VCASLVDALVERGNDVTLIAAGRNHTRGRFVQTVETPPGEGGDFASLTEVIHAARAVRALDNLEVDVVHDHSLAGPLTAKAHRAPTVVTAHMPVAGPESWAEYYAAIGENVSLVALSDAQQHAAPHLRWAAVVPNGIEVDQFPFRQDKDEYVLYLGRISTTKGIELVIAGKGTIPSEHRYFEQRILPQLGDRVEWVGEVSGQRKLDLLARARCLVFPIRWQEPFGLVLLEAMACGTPIVALGEGAVPEIVEDGRTGILCQDPAELAAGINAASRLSARECRAHVRHHFSAKRMAERYEAAYRGVIA
jgi:glycosyltransferase involved in cell wall biosynthesis